MFEQSRNFRTQKTRKSQKNRMFPVAMVIASKTTLPSPISPMLFKDFFSPTFFVLKIFHKIFSKFLEH